MLRRIVEAVYIKLYVAFTMDSVVLQRALAPVPVRYNVMNHAAMSTIMLWRCLKGSSSVVSSICFLQTVQYYGAETMAPDR